MMPKMLRSPVAIVAVDVNQMLHSFQGQDTVLSSACHKQNSGPDEENKLYNTFAIEIVENYFSKPRSRE
jgi:hypothetical protein